MIRTMTFAAAVTLAGTSAFAQTATQGPVDGEAITATQTGGEFAVILIPATVTVAAFVAPTQNGNSSTSTPSTPSTPATP